MYSFDLNGFNFFYIKSNLIVNIIRLKKLNLLAGRSLIILVIGFLFLNSFSSAHLIYLSCEGERKTSDLISEKKSEVLKFDLEVNDQSGEFSFGGIAFDGHKIAQVKNPKEKFIFKISNTKFESVHSISIFPDDLFFPNFKLVYTTNIELNRYSGKLNEFQFKWIGAPRVQTEIVNGSYQCQKNTSPKF